MTTKHVAACFIGLLGFSFLGSAASPQDPSKDQPNTRPDTQGFQTESGSSKPNGTEVTKPDSAAAKQDKKERKFTAQQEERIKSLVAEEVAKAKGDFCKDKVRREEFTDALKELKAELAAIAARVKSVEALATRVAAIEDQFKTTKNEIVSLEKRVRTIEDKLKNVLDKDKSGADMLALRGQMKLDDFKIQFAEAVAATEVTGKLRVHNYTGAALDLYINGRKVRIDVRKDDEDAVKNPQEITVPVGAVTTELWPYERPKTWILNNSNGFTQDVKLRNRQPGPWIPWSPFAEPPNAGMKP